MTGRRFIQLLPTAAFGDAVGNDALAIHRIMCEYGPEPEMYAENIDPRYPLKTVRRTSEMPALSDADVLIYHASTGTDLNLAIRGMPGKKILIYHNITPPLYFEEYSADAFSLTSYGYAGIRKLGSSVDFCIADSEYNAAELRRMGYRCPVEVCPILIPFEDYGKKPDEQVLKKVREDGWTNLLFVGRIAPNKMQEDVIRAFYCYRRRFNGKSRLFLVGSGTGMERYDRRLKEYVKKLGLEDSVFFTGHISFAGILAYYQAADVFVCMSEHEGFCVPLLEAMYFEKPIVAYRAAAVPETLGRGGILLDRKDPEFAARAIHRLLGDEALKSAVRAAQKERLKDYAYETVRNRFLDILDRYVGGFGRKPGQEIPAGG